MKDIIEKVLPLAPQFFNDLGALLMHPKEFIAQRDSAAEDAFTQALVFLAVSVALTSLATAPIFPEKSLWTRLAGAGLESLLAIALFSIVLRIAWRIVGGSATLRSFAVTYAYFAGVIGIISTAFVLLSVGIMKTFDPALYDFIQRSGGRLASLAAERPLIPADLRLSPAVFVVAFTLALSIVASAAWAVYAWGAFRHLNRASKRQSAIALVISTLLSVPVLAALAFVSDAVGGS